MPITYHSLMFPQNGCCLCKIKQMKVSYLKCHILNRNSFGHSAWRYVSESKQLSAEKSNSLWYVCLKAFMGLGMEAIQGPILKKTLPIPIRLNWSVPQWEEHCIGTQMFICRDFFAILSGPARRNVSLFFLGKFKETLLEGYLKMQLLKLQIQVSFYSILYSGK